MEKVTVALLVAFGVLATAAAVFADDIPPPVEQCCLCTCTGGRLAFCADISEAPSARCTEECGGEIESFACSVPACSEVPQCNVAAAPVAGDTSMIALATLLAALGVMLARSRRLYLRT